MSRAIMQAELEADQERAEVAFEALPQEQQRSILEAEIDVELSDDDDPFAPVKPKRIRPYRTYTFTSPNYGRIPELTIAAGVRKHDRQNITPSRSTYNRFVRLANTGNYAVEIMDSDYGVAWQMRRRSDAPVEPARDRMREPEPQNYRSEREYLEALDKYYDALAEARTDYAHPLN